MYLNAKIFDYSVETVWIGNKRYWKVPVIAVVEGVLNGSQGPYFYPAQEIKASINKWEGIPVTINHPSDGLTSDYYAQWGVVGIIPDIIGFALIAFMARLLIRSEVKRELDS